MAKKDKNKKPARKKLPEGQVRLDKSQQKVLKDVEGGKNLANLTGLDKPLSRLDTAIPEDRRALIESIRALSDPNSEAFVGRRSEEEKGALGSLRDLMDRAGTRSEEESKAISNLDKLVGSAGVRSSDMQGLLADMKSKAATAGQRSADMQETLNLMKSGLAGLNSQENQALREQAQKEVDRKLQSSLEDLQAATRRSGMAAAGRAGARNARRDAMMAQADLEQKNLLANVDVQDRRRSEYANTLSGAEAAEFGRGMQATDMYGRQLSDTENAEYGQRSDAAKAYAGGVNDLSANMWNRQNAATQGYANTAIGLGQNERERVRGALGDYGNALGERDNYFLDTAKVNLGQERTDRAAQTQAALGLSGLTVNERERRRQLRASKRRGGDGRNSGAQPGTTQPGQYGGFNSANDQEYYNTIQNIYNQGA